jgi:hypothetical protein
LLKLIAPLTIPLIPVIRPLNAKRIVALIPMRIPPIRPLIQLNSAIIIYYLSSDKTYEL